MAIRAAVSHASGGLPRVDADVVILQIICLLLVNRTPEQGLGPVPSPAAYSRAPTNVMFEALDISSVNSKLEAELASRT